MLGLTSILALYASGLAMTVLTSSVPGAFAASSSNSSVSGDNNKIDKSEKQLYLEGAKNCFDTSHDYLQLENCLADTINNIIASDHDEQQK
ncbi:MAG TPA: hypothetical protein VHK86_03770 [Nitrososphaera sp.]|nr:hypothetical protein [Nitrososphaera sp.]